MKALSKSSDSKKIAKEMKDPPTGKKVKSNGLKYPQFDGMKKTVKAAMKADKGRK